MGFLRKAWLVQLSHGGIWRLEADTTHSSQQQALADNTTLSNACAYAQQRTASHTRACIAEGKGDIIAHRIGCDRHSMNTRLAPAHQLVRVQ